jgi:uncharacterized membrane protein YhiD involved in acid resistance
MTALVYSASGTANFQNWLATNPAPTAQASVPAANGNSNGTTTSFQSLLGQLTGYVNETPAQRMQNSILAQLGITPQQLQSMSPQERQQVEAKIQQLMKTEMQAQQQQQQQQQQQVQAQMQQQVQTQTQQQASQSATHSSSRHAIPMINLFA